MTAQLYYVSSKPDDSARPAELKELASLLNWQGAHRFFAAGTGKNLPGLGEVSMLTPPAGIPANGFIYGRVSSTFDRAWKLLRHGLLPVWGFAMAAVQTKGRGQLRRRWSSEPGNLYVTFRLPEDMNVEAGALLTGYLLQRALAALGAAVQVKWPNDLIQDGCKVGGILLEERGGVVLAGMGLNFAHAPGRPEPAAGEEGTHFFPAGVLRSENNLINTRPPAMLNVWLELVKQITLSYEQDLACRSLEQRLALLENCLAFKGAVVTVHEPGFSDADSSCHEHRVSGQIMGLGPKGELRILLSSGRERLLHSGSLSFENN